MSLDRWNRQNLGVTVVNRRRSRMVYSDPIESRVVDRKYQLQVVAGRRLR